MERMSHTLLSMLDDYNTLLQRKALFPSWSECTACVPGPQKALTFSTRGEQRKRNAPPNPKKNLAHGSTGLRHDVDPLRLLHLRCYCNISNAAATTTLPVVAWGASGLSAAIWAEMIHLCSCVLQQKLFFGHDTFGENHLYLAPNQARRVISAGRHWAAAISCPLISLKGGLGQYTLRNRANNALVVLHKGSHKLWHGVKTPAANLVLSAVLLPSIRADLPSHPPPKPRPTKPAFTGWSGTCSCGVTASHRCPD